MFDFRYTTHGTPFQVVDVLKCDFFRAPLEEGTVSLAFFEKNAIEMQHIERTYIM
jgi:hypothetical protein